MKSRCFRTTSSIAVLTSLLAFAPSAVFAQDTTESASSGSEIVVTAQRREEKSVDVPITVTTLSQDTLATANVQQLTDISKVTPALRFDASSGFVQPTIRGVGTAVVTSGGGGNVGIYVDGFYSPNPLGIDFQLMNVSSIQVLKGPQGTLFGRNTTGGAILVQTGDPSHETSVRAKLSYGRFNEARAQAYYTVGISDRVAMDFEGMYSRGDGWQTNISNNQRVGDYENWSVRMGMKADLTDDVSLVLRYQHGEINDSQKVLPASYYDPVFGSGAPFFAVPGQFTYDPDEVATGTQPADQELLKSRSNVVQATLKADLGFADLTSYTQWRSEKVNQAIESDYSGVEVYELGLPNDNETLSQELLLTSKPGTALQWTAGLFYFQNRDTYKVYFDYFPAFGINGRSDANRFGSSTTTKGFAAFVDATYEVTPQLFITAGGRYAHDQVDDAYFIHPPAFLLPPGVVLPGYPTRNYIKDVNPAAYEAARQDHFTPRVVVRYKPTDDTSIYASWTKGYKASLLDVGGGGGAYVRPEKIDAYEVGFKYDGSALSVETSAFYYDYKDLQVSLYRTGLAQILNAANSEIYGIDAQLRYDFNDNFQVNLGGAWVHARYKRFEDAPVYTPCLTTISAANPGGLENCATLGTSFVVVPTLLTNTTMQRTPEFTGNIGARYRTDLAGGELSLSGNLFYSSKFFMGPSGIQWPQEAFETLSLRAQWTDPSEHYTVALWGDNVTNNRHRTAIQFGNPGIGVNWNKPVTYGVEVGLKF